jgi:hypothetical protein
MIKRFEAPLLWLAFFLLLGGAVAVNWPFILLAAAIVIHFL